MKHQNNLDQLSKAEFQQIISTHETRIKKNPNDLESLTLLSQTYIKFGNFNQAAHHLTTIIKLNSSAIWAYHELNTILTKFGRINDAKSVIRQALLVDPDNAQSHLKFGTLLSEENNLIAGEWHFRRALELVPSDADTKSNLALNLMQQGKTDEAYTQYQQAAELAPSDFKIIAHWSKLCEVTGNLKQANALLNKAASIASPEAVDLLRSNYMARTGKHEQVIEIISASKNPNGDALLERGKAYDRVNEYDKAWSDFINGKKKLIKENPSLEYQSRPIDDFFSALTSFFTPELMAQLPKAPIRKDCAQPIFILGSPRSGTTLTERVLGAHSDINAGGELVFLSELRELANKILPSASFPNNLAHSCTADFRHLATLFRDQYLARSEATGLLNTNRAYFTDKMPFNEIYLPLLKMAFPKSPVIYVTRHPLDICVSMMSHRINHGFHCAYSVENIIHHLNLVHKVTRHYRTIMDTGLLPFKYEDFVGNQEQQTRKLIDYIGLPFDDACLHFQTNKSYTPTPSYIQIQSEVTDTAIGRYKNYQKYLSQYEPQLADMLLDQGY